MSTNMCIKIGLVSKCGITNSTLKYFSPVCVFIFICLTILDCPCVAQWLGRLLGVWEAGVRCPTASHQRRKNWEVCTSRLVLGINELGNRLGSLE